MMAAEIREFCEKNAIRLMVLFGSQSTGPAHDRSDIDIAVLPERGRDPAKLEMIFQLQELFDERTVDLVILTDQTDPLLLHEIYSKGRPLYEKEEGIFESQRLRAWKLYMDTRKIREMRRQYLKEYVRRMSHVA